LLGGRKTCVIVDPARDVEAYIEAANALNMNISGVLETHLHADFISGHLELAEKTGCKIYAPKSGKCEFDHTGLAEGDVLEVDDLVIKVWETPGHTPEHLSYTVVDTSRGSEASGVFCGDTLFVGDVGRPDLFPEIATGLASQLYDSLHKKLLTLPDFCEVYPAHHAGSLCGRAIGAKRTSTIGYEKRYNASLNISSREAFIHSLTTNMPAAPDHFGRCSNTNRSGPTLLRELHGPEAVEPGVFRNMVESGGATILDVRSYEAFGGQFIPGSYHNDIGGNFAVFSGWVVPPGPDILLVVDNEAQARAAIAGLRRVGLDHIAGYLNGGLFAWAIEGLPAEHVNQLSAGETHHMLTGDKEMLLLDVRSVEEYAISHIDGAYNIPAPDLRSRYRELNPDAVISVICSTGRRSSLAASILKQHRFRNVYNVAGGMTGYSAAGYGPECPVCTIPHSPRLVG